ncbi:MAG: hypothetical protein ACPG4F_07810, partial [Paracoccaceae bacterium]
GTSCQVIVPVIAVKAITAFIAPHQDSAGSMGREQLQSGKLVNGNGFKKDIFEAKSCTGYKVFMAQTVANAN